MRFYKIDLYGRCKLKSGLIQVFGGIPLSSQGAACKYAIQEVLQAMKNSYAVCRRASQFHQSYSYSTWQSLCTVKF